MVILKNHVLTEKKEIFQGQAPTRAAKSTIRYQLRDQRLGT